MSKELCSRKTSYHRRKKHKKCCKCKCCRPIIIKKKCPICPICPLSVEIIGPYLKLIVEVLFPPGGSPLFPDFYLNVQYYNQGNYYSTYEHLFSDLINGPYGMTQSSTVNAIQQYFERKYNNNVPQVVKDSIVVGKLLTMSAGESSYVDLNTLASWFTTAQSASILTGGYMFWSAGYFNTTYPSDTLVSGTFSGVTAKHKVMYIGAGGPGFVWLADGSGMRTAQGSDPDGSNALDVLVSYASAGFTDLILAFWNYPGIPASNSDWVIDWASIPDAFQQSNIAALRAINPDVKVLVSAGGAYGNVGPSSGIDPVAYGTALYNFTVDNNLDGIDLDFEGSLLGLWWSFEQYGWVETVVKTIASLDVSNSLTMSFAPVGPLCAVPLV